MTIKKGSGAKTKKTNDKSHIKDLLKQGMSPRLAVQTHKQYLSQKKS